MGDREFAAFQSKPVVAIGIRGHAIGRQIVEPRHASAAMAAAASFRGDICRIYRRAGIVGFENQMFPVAIHAYRSVFRANAHGFAMNALLVSFGDLLVASAAGSRKPPTVYV